ncbi:hypothetical protein [Sphingobacterium mizutaii]|uniref:hypothetical protein n=1 Tax=Sphingobacterium mizutaii TaxID=1010 RepID=UPI00162A0F27|nr:hypothetical protein [Sphingobacterium mizutaii]
MDRKTIIAWGIKWKTGIILPFSIRQTRREAIKDMESNHKSQWKQLKKQGMSTVKLEIKEAAQQTKRNLNKDSREPFPQLELFK